MLKDQLMSTVEYKELGYNLVICPVCGKPTLDNHWVCSNCLWEYDGTTTLGYSSANKSTLSQYKVSYFANLLVDLYNYED